MRRALLGLYLGWAAVPWAAAEEPAPALGAAAPPPATALGLGEVCLYASQVYSEGAQAPLNGTVMVCVRAQGRLRWQPLYGPDERFMAGDDEP